MEELGILCSRLSLAWPLPRALSIYNDLPLVCIIAVQGRLPGELALAYRHKNCADTLKVRYMWYDIYIYIYISGEEIRDGP